AVPFASTSLRTTRPPSSCGNCAAIGAGWVRRKSASSWRRSVLTVPIYDSLSRTHFCHPTAVGSCSGGIRGGTCCSDPTEKQLPRQSMKFELKPDLPDDQADSLSELRILDNVVWI